MKFFSRIRAAKQKLRSIPKPRWHPSAPWLIAASVVLLWLLVLLFFPDFVQAYANPTIWVTANVSLGYAALVTVAYTVFYFTKFRWREYSAARSIMYSYLSQSGLITLAVIGIFLDPGTTGVWYMYLDGVAVARPSLRLLVYGALALANTRMFVQLIIRYRRGLRMEITAEPKLTPAQAAPPGK